MKTGSSAKAGGKLKRDVASADEDDIINTPATTLKGGLIVQDVTAGTGASAENGKTLSVSYIGKLKSNGKVFDSSKPGKTFNFVLGAGKVIKGWDQGMKGMKVGGTRILTVPPAMGYGSKGCPPDIPGDSTLVFEVKLLSVK